MGTCREAQIGFLRQATRLESDKVADRVDGGSCGTLFGTIVDRCITQIPASHEGRAAARVGFHETSAPSKAVKAGTTCPTDGVREL